MKTLFPFLNGFKKETILAPLFKMLEASFDLCVPLVMAAIIDHGIKNGDTAYVLQLCGVLILLGLIGLTCSITAQYFAAKAAVGFAVSLRKALFAKIQSLSFAQMDTIGGSTLITRMTSDVNQVQNGLNLFLRLFLRSPFVVLGSVILSFTLNFEAALIFTLTVPLLSIVIFGIMRLTMPLYKNVQAKLDQLLGLVRENLAGVRVVRAFDKQNHEIAQFAAANGGLTTLQLKVGQLSNLLNPLTYCIINIAIIALLFIGAKQVGNSTLMQGDVIALVNYMGQILVELVKLATLIVQTSKALACAGRVTRILETEPDMVFADGSASQTHEPESQNTLSASTSKIAPSTTSRCAQVNTATNSQAHAVCFDNVSLRYAGAGAESLSNVSFTATAGQTIGIIGGTGSGKTSLVHLIPRFYDATTGTVSVFGQDVCTYAKEALRHAIGIVPQRAQLFQGTIRSNLLWGNENATDDDLWQALEQAQGAEFVRQKPDGLDTAVAQGGQNFSGGQRQRLTIARALVKQPSILILDDSASALDYATDAALRKAIANLPYQTTTFIVSQRTSSLAHADQIIVLDDGNVCGIGTHDALLSTCTVYKEIHESQFAKGDATHAKC